MRCIHPRAGYVEHHAPVGEARSILDVQRRQPERQRALPGIDLGRQEAEELLDAVEDAAVGAALDGDVVGEDVEPVGLLAERGVERQHERRVGGVLLACARQREVRAQVVGQRLEPLFVGDERRSREEKLASEVGTVGRCGLCLGRQREEPQGGRREQMTYFHGENGCFCLVQSYIFSAEFVTLPQLWSEGALRPSCGRQPHGDLPAECVRMRTGSVKQTIQRYSILWKTNVWRPRPGCWR